MLQDFLEHFGYLALFLGTFFEGEAVLVLAGFLAFQGYLRLELVVLVAFLGAWSGDQLWYTLGRRYGRGLLARKPRWEQLGEKALVRLRRHPDLWVLGFRFVYGLRTVMPLAIGVSGYPPRRFLLFNGLGAAIWASVLGLAAFHFGNLLEAILGEVKRYELFVLAALLVLAALFWLWRRWRQRP
ncbi:DedA family protein [Alloalcanivorax sp. C16-1]|uniref:DedA family protein n=1 Tax=Alloalcanivorax sp. C16-1 TaxID=3390051 RepID=UPI003970B5BA